MLRTYRLRDLGTWVKRTTGKSCRTDPDAKASRQRATARSPSAVLAGKFQRQSAETRSGNTRPTSSTPPKGYILGRVAPKPLEPLFAGPELFPRKLPRRGFRPRSFCVPALTPSTKTRYSNGSAGPNRRAIRMQTLNGWRRTDGEPRRRISTRPCANARKQEAD
jgi:hypothetical protein